MDFKALENLEITPFLRLFLKFISLFAVAFFYGKVMLGKVEK